MLTLVLSFVIYGHSINAIQSVGLFLSVVSMVANFYDKVPLAPSPSNLDLFPVGRKEEATTRVDR
jgi:hypothetical protein